MFRLNLRVSVNIRDTLSRNYKTLRNKHSYHNKIERLDQWPCQNLGYGMAGGVAGLTETIFNPVNPKIGPML